jgi:multicomponent Na+:H+ antiporter subunit D
VDWQTLLPVLILLSSFVTGVLIFPLAEERRTARTILNLTGAVAKVVLVGVTVWGVVEGFRFETRFAFLPGLDLVLRVDTIALLFLMLSAVLWLLTTIYAIGYLEDSPDRSRFFGFFSLCVTATMGIALAGNMITFFIFYELLTVATYPLVVHRQTQAAVDAGKTYLGYTLSGGVLLLLGVVWLQQVAGPVEFAPGGALDAAIATHPAQLTLIFGLLIAGLGVKAALVPLHGWLPVAMVAPAPVSALLHAVAVVKAGAFGIVRVVHDLYGAGPAASLGVLLPLAVVAGITILYGSMRALSQDDLKRRLAYSTVSQIAYITLAAALVGQVATTAALAHLMHQGLMKVTLFFCAGNLAQELGINRVSDMDGVGRRMPLTMLAFTLAAFGMIGVPPMAGFISKWYLGIGGLESGQGWVILVLATSSLLNAAYFLPIVAAAWLRPYRGRGRADASDAAVDDDAIHRGRETIRALLVPTLVTAGLALGAGLLAGMPFSPLDLASRAAHEIYGTP